jgi:hypothetical protein
MRLVTLGMSTAAAAGALTLVMAGQAAAAQAPNDRASCLAQVFQSQAVGEPGEVADRILFIREVELQGDSFGQVLKPLAQDRCS